MAEATSSWGERYRYRRKWLLDKVPHVLLHTGVVLLLPVHTPGLYRQFRREEGVVRVRIVVLRTADERALNRRHR